MMACFIYGYYPWQQRQVAMKSIETKVRSISNVFSIGVGIGMGETDLVAVSEALQWAREDSAVVYITVENQRNQKIASFNAMSYPLPKSFIQGIAYNTLVELDGVLYYKSNIVYQGIPAGSLVIAYSLQHVYSMLSELKITTLYFCVTLFVAGVILSVLIGNRITGNINTLFNTVKVITNGNENIYVDVKTQDEIGKLGLAFNQMLHRLERSRAELKAYSERLEKQNDELNQFSYVVSHDLKAPLRAIFKLSEWIEDDLGDILSGETKKNMEILRGRVYRLEALINGLLEYSKIGRLCIPTERVDVQLMLKDVVEILNPPSHVMIYIQHGMPVIQTKRILLQQVFINLISNAIKYNDKQQGCIRVSVCDKGDFYQFAVEDNGMGIDKAYHDKIFEIFQTLQSRDQVEGTGIGLAIIKKSVEDMRGTIRVESEEHKGARFTFTWPKAA
jgi:signal transduction histidine kinase